MPIPPKTSPSPRLSALLYTPSYNLKIVTGRTGIPLMFDQNSTPVLRVSLSSVLALFHLCHPHPLQV